MKRDAMSYLMRLLTVLLCPLALIACSSGDEAPAERPPLEGAAIGGPFTLVDKTGSEVRWSDFAGRYRIVYFGYTFCPDACPLDVQAMMAGFRTFEEAHPALAKKVQPIFITIDPARDTPKAVGDYAAAFHPRLLGLTGTAGQVDQAAKAFAVYYAKGEESAGGYLMDHSRTAFLMSPEGEPIALLPADKGPFEEASAAVAAELERWVR
jgi:protein SCO1